MHYKNILIVLLFFVHCLSAQTIPDSLKNKTFSELKERFYRVDKKDTIALKMYAKAFLFKGLEQKDTLKIAKGYYYCYTVYKDKEVGQMYLDTIIKLTENKSYEYYPLIAINLKSRYYFQKHDYDNSLKYLFKLRRLNKKQYYKEDVEFQTSHYIGLIKSRLGEYEEALGIFLNNRNYNLDTGNELVVTFAIADSYRFLKKLDSSSFYNNKGIIQSLKHKNDVFYNYFLLNEGATLSDKGLYERSIDSLDKSIHRIIEVGDKKNIAMGYYFLGKNNYMLGNKGKAVAYFKKMDSIFAITKDIHPELREGYEYLIKEAKSNNDTKNEIFYINRLLTLDKILSNNYKVLSKKLMLEYDTPKLLAQKDAIINTIKESKKKYNNYIFLLMGLVSLILVFLIGLNQKRKKYKKRLEDLLSKNKKIVAGNAGKSIKVNKSLGINPTTVSNILNSLEEFEKGKGYLKSKITAYSLAKKLNTNTQYLSKIINHYKKENFSNYLNNLRVNYIVDRLIKDEQYRKYTIQAIAMEAGFNNSESFATAFMKKTGIKPSYFIKNIEKYSRDL